MASDPEIKANENCEHSNGGLFDYWHENDNCGLDDCLVVECGECGMFATSCGMEAEAIPEATPEAEQEAEQEE